MLLSETLTYHYKMIDKAAVKGGAIAALRSPNHFCSTLNHSTHIPVDSEIFQVVKLKIAIL